MIDKNSSATQLVEKLRIKGLVKREICKNYRRQVDINITSKGLNLLAKIDHSSDTRWSALKNLSKQRRNN